MARDATDQQSTKVQRITSLFWWVLFLDQAWLFLQFGGLGVTDLLVHGGFLLLATGLLSLERSTLKIKRVWVLWLGLPLIVGALQMLRVSSDLLATLNPIKHRIVQDVSAIYPDLAVSSELTMMPQLHLFHYLILVMDVYLAILLLMAKRPTQQMMLRFVQLLALGMALINILATSDRIKDLPFLARFHETYGGLVNPNHFAMLSAVFMVLLLAISLIKLKGLWLGFQERNARQSLPERIGSLGITVLCFGLTFISFRSVYSRSGIVVLILMVFVLGVYAFWQIFAGVKLKWKLIFGSIIFLSIVLFLPLGRGIDKFADKALDNLRVTQFQIGLDYLKERPYLGVGMGATKSILHPLVSRETVYDLRLSTDFHNEYLQVTVEYGLVGILVLVSMLAWLFIKLFPKKNDGRLPVRILRVGIWCMLAGMAFHSLFSFPLRVTAIRFFAMIMVAYGLKLCSEDRLIQRPKWVFGAMGLCLVVCMTLMALNHLRAKQRHQPEPGSLAYKAYRYGDYHQMLKYQANDALQDTLEYLGDLDGLNKKLQHNQELYEQYLYQQPFSLQALNGLFMIEVMRHRMETLDFDPHQFAIWENRVKAINALGQDRNINARLARFFLYANYLDHLNQEQVSYYERMKEELAFRYRDASEKAEGMAPQK